MDLAQLFRNRLNPYTASDDMAVLFADDVTRYVHGKCRSATLLKLRFSQRMYREILIFGELGIDPPARVFWQEIAQYLIGHGLRWEPATCYGSVDAVVEQLEAADVSAQGLRNGNGEYVLHVERRKGSGS